MRNDNNSEATSSVITTSTTIETLNTEDDAPQLTLKVTPANNVVGIDSGKDAQQAVVCATVKASELPDGDESDRAPVDITVALDVSGSMHGDKLRLCKITLELLLRQLTKQDRFGLISFGSDARIEVPMRRLGHYERSQALHKIKALETRGCTNMSAAIGLATQELRSIGSSGSHEADCFPDDCPNAVRSIFLLTDGLANEGISDRTGLKQLAANCLGCLSGSGQSPVTLHCFGYGSQHNGSLLSELSKTTQGGIYHFVETDSGVASAFGDALGGILSVVAQTALIDIRVPDNAKEAGVKILDVCHNRKICVDDWHCKVTLGDFYAEESRDVLFKIQLSASELSCPHVEVSMSYFDVINKTLADTSTSECYIARPAGSFVSTTHQYVEVQWLRNTCVQEMEKAEQLARSCNLVEAKKKIDGTLKTLKDKETLQNDPLIQQLIIDMNETNLGLASQTAYESHGEQILNQNCMYHEAQRSVRTSSSANNAPYSRNKKRTGLLLRFARAMKDNS